MRLSLCTFVGSFGCAASALAAGRAASYGVFGGNDVTFQGFATVSGAPVASNGNVHHTAGIGTFDGIYGAGELNPAPPQAWNARQKVVGDVVFNGNINLNALSSVSGSIHGGGSVLLGVSGSVGQAVMAAGPVNVLSFNTIGGNVVAGGTTTLVNGVNVAGNVGANGPVSLGIDSHVTGTVTHNGSLTLGAHSSVGGSQAGTVNPQPATYQPASLPGATSFTSGGANVSLAVFEDRTLAPGSYGAMTFAGSNTLSLSPGDYYFDSISSPGAFVDLDLTIGAGIRIFVTGNVQFNSVDAIVNGGSFGGADSALASRVYLESRGSILHDGRFFGTLHAPLGDVTTGAISDVTGSILAGHHAILGSSTDVIYAGSEYLGVPEPSALGVVAGAAVFARRRRAYSAR